MEPSEYQTIYEVEDQHWWYVGMQCITTTLIASLYPNRTDLQILDAGCGTGAVMNYLSPFGSVTGGDFSPLALHFCQQRGLNQLTQMSVSQLPFVSNRFDLVTSFDVLYHRAVPDYHQALAEFHRVLKPNGYLFLRLPAYDWLRGHHDDIIHTARRFTIKELRHALLKTQFRVEKLSYANTLLFPLALGKRVAEKIRPPSSDVSDVSSNPVWQDNLLVQFLFAEARWLNGRSLPWGLTVIAIGQKLV